MAASLIRKTKARRPKRSLLAAERAKRDLAARESGLVIPLSEWLGHNNGPSLLTPTAYLKYIWRKAYDAAWSEPNADIVSLRLRRAAALGLSYNDYVLELLERGGHPEPSAIRPA